MKIIVNVDESILCESQNTRKNPLILEIMQSVAYKSLNLSCKLLLLTMCIECDVKKYEEEFAYSLNTIQKVLGVSLPTAVNTIKQLIKFGFIKRTNNSRYSKQVSKFIFIETYKQFIPKIKLQPNEGYVYVVRCGTDYKIGVSIKPESRLVEFTKLSHELEPIICARVNNYKQVEKELHEKYRHKYLRGEWFGLNDDDIKDIVAFLNLK